MNRRRAVSLALILLFAVLVGAAVWLWSHETAPEAAVDQLGHEIVPSEETTTLPGQLGSGYRASGPWWEVSFTAPVFPDDRQRHTGGLDARLVELINSAQRSLDVAIYDFDLSHVAEAMAQAARRGVTVRMVTDTDTVRNQDRAVQAALRIVREANIPIVDDNRPAIMHHKFTVGDGEWVATGSWNYTDGDTYRLNNNLLLIRNKQVAANYTAEFEKMFTERRFGPEKRRGTPNPVLTLDGSRIATYFSPQDRPSNRIIEAIKNAQREIHFLAFSFTHDQIGRALLERHQAGVQVIGVFERTGSNTPFSEFGALRQAGAEVYQDGNRWSMHHKVFIIDDRLVITGSYNFSRNADRDNDENLLIIEDPALAAAYEKEFQFILERAKRGPPP